MKKRSLFQIVLLYLIAASFLTATLTVVIYCMTGTRAYSRRVLDELTPRASGIAMLAARYQTGQISYDSFIEFATKAQRGSEVYIFDGQGNLAVRSERVQMERIDQLIPFVDTVLQTGDTVTSTKWQRSTGILVAVPITDNMQRVGGVVIVKKPTAEVFPALASLIGSLLFSSVIAIIIILIPTYFSTRSIIRPIRQMTDIAASMANGDFRLRADDTRQDEVGMLGSALNYLSGALRDTIEDLIAEKNHMDRILSGISEGIVAFDDDGTITYANPAAAVLLQCGQDAQSIVDKLCPLTVLLEEVKKDHTTRTQMLPSGQTTLQATLSLTQEIAGKPTGSIVLLQDVTERERLEQTRRDYVANVSHELRTPIASVRSLAEALNDGLVKTEDDRSRYYSYILRESLRLSRLIDDLLELSRLQSGSIALTKEDFPLDALLTDVTGRMRASAFESGITLSYVPNPDCLMVHSNRDRIEQVLIALLDNAIKYASDDGCVHVSVAIDERVCVRISNTGHINGKDLPHLFERFYKADQAHSSGGTGLGLAIASEIMAKLNERIWAENEGEEAVFSFTVSRALALES